MMKALFYIVFAFLLGTACASMVLDLAIAEMVLLFIASGIFAIAGVLA